MIRLRCLLFFTGRAGAVCFEPFYLRHRGGRRYYGSAVLETGCCFDRKVIPIALRANLLFSGLFTILAGFCPEILCASLQMMLPWLQAEASILRAVALSYVLCGISQVYLILLKTPVMQQSAPASVPLRLTEHHFKCHPHLRSLRCSCTSGSAEQLNTTVAARVIGTDLGLSRGQRDRGVAGFSGTASSLPPGKILSRDFWRYTLPVLAASLVWGNCPTFCTPLSWDIWEAMPLRANSITS